MVIAELLALFIMNSSLLNVGQARNALGKKRRSPSFSAPLFGLALFACYLFIAPDCICGVIATDSEGARLMLALYVLNTLHVVLLNGLVSRGGSRGSVGESGPRHE